MSKTYKIKGMHCASCAAIIEKKLREVSEIESVRVNFATENMEIDFNESKITPQQISEFIKPLGYELQLEKKKTLKSESSDYTEFSQIAIGLVLAFFSAFLMGWEILIELSYLPKMNEILMGFFHHLMPIFATYALFVLGGRYLVGMWRFLRYGVANMDTLIGIGTSVAFLYSFVLSAFEEILKNYVDVSASYYDVTIVVIAFVSLGKYLEKNSKRKTGDAIKKLLKLQAKTALVLRDGREVEMEISNLQHGDLIRVRPGSRIAVDGVVVEGHGFVDESTISGEAMPIEKNPGDPAISSTLLANGTFVFRATKVGAETLLAQIIKMVETAQNSKAPIQALVDRISAVFVPIVLILAVLSLLSWLILGSYLWNLEAALPFALSAFVGILVIACPCALGLATPTAIIVGVGKGAENGILVKDAATLQKLREVNALLIDKTGTLTKGKIELNSIENKSNFSERELVSILYSLEKNSEHPIAEAIRRYAKREKIDSQATEKFEILKGKGVTAEIKGKKYFAGNLKLISDLKLEFAENSIEKETKQGKTPILLTDETQILGVFMVSDTIKEEAKTAIEEIKNLGIKPIMLSGDNANTAKFIAAQLGIEEVIAEVLPQDKQNEVRKLQAKGFVVAMAGDGVNDSPALAQADVGIAMATGTDVAIESAGITLLRGDIRKITSAIRLSKFTMTGIKQNLFWAFVYNAIGIPLAAGVFYPYFGWTLNPVFAGAAMALSSLSVVSNSLRLKFKKL
jgi:Cu2+-exporting ATPase/Cu+-exporting ATPase